MEEEVTPSPEYIKGFNEGYLIAKELPELADKLPTIKSDDDRTRGILDGSKEYLLEKIKDLRPAWLRDKNKSQDRTQARSRDKEKDF